MGDGDSLLPDLSERRTCIRYDITATGVVKVY